jgi:hypothetical protein
MKQWKAHELPNESCFCLLGRDLNMVLKPSSMLLSALATKGCKKMPTSFTMSVCPCICMQQGQNHWRDFHGIWQLGVLLQFVNKFCKKLGILSEDLHGFLCINMTLKSWGGGSIMKSSPTMGTNTLLMQRSLTSKNSAVTGTIHKGQRPYFD